VKLVIEEPEAAALRSTIVGKTQIASAIVEVEVIRAVRRRDPDMLAQAERVVSQVTRIGMSEELRVRAALLEPTELRSLDALHLATALAVRHRLEGFVSYDGRLADAARRAGLVVLTPR
jgi:uncharacterized protein